MIKKVSLYICDDCDMVGVGAPDQTCTDCGKPMKYVVFVRALESLDAADHWTRQAGDVEIVDYL